MFITFEGIGGCGKSTQSKKVVEYLRKIGHEVFHTREPGGSPGAEEIRRLILEGDGNRWSAETEILLFNAARRDHLERLVWPAQKSGKIVISDRFVDSTRVYQGVARADLRGLVDELHTLVINYEADLTLVIDIDVKTAMERMSLRSGEQDRFDEMGMKFQQDLRDGYLSLGKEFPERCIIVDGLGPQDEVFSRVKAVVMKRLGT